MKDFLESLIGGLISVALIALPVIGWILNVIKLSNMDADPVTGMLICRILGILFVPLGVVMGFIG